MILTHLAYGIDLMALTVATALLIWSLRTPGTGSWLGKLVGAGVMIFAIVSIICIYSCTLNGTACHQPLMIGEEGAATSLNGEVNHRHVDVKKMEHKK